MGNKVYVQADGPVPEYLTAGRVYEATWCGSNRKGLSLYAITDDSGRAIQILTGGNCEHLPFGGYWWALCDQHGNPLAEQESEAAAKTCMCPNHGNWIAADDYSRNVKALDVALNGEGGAQSPRLIDVLAQTEALRRKYGRPVLQQIDWIRNRGREMLDDITAKNMEIVDLRTEIARYKALAGGLAEALDTLTAIVGLTAFKYEAQRAVLQEALDAGRAALAKHEQEKGV